MNLIRTKKLFLNDWVSADTNIISSYTPLSTILLSHLAQ